MSGFKNILLQTVVALPVLAFAGSIFAIEPFENKDRLVVVGGSLIEIVYALDEQEHVIARDMTSTYPIEATDLIDVGYARQLSPEGVLSVDPTGILLLDGSGPQETLDVIAESKVPYQMISEDHSQQGIIDKIKAVGIAFDVSEKADALAHEIDVQLNEVRALTNGIEHKQKVLFVMTLQGGRVMAAGDNTSATGMLELAGAVNALTGFSGYKTVTDEAIIEAMPDAILVMDRGGDLAVAEEDVFANPAIALTPAGQNKKFLAMDGSYLLNFGPRTASAVKDIVEYLYPDL